MRFSTLGSILIIACAGMMYLSVVTIRDELISYGLIEYARIIERDGNLADLPIGTLISQKHKLMNIESCDRDQTRSRVTIGLFLADRLDKTSPSAFSMRDVQSLVRHALRCNPRDGNMLFLVGWVDWKLGGSHEAFIGYLLQSMRQSPYEGFVIEKRWKVAPYILRHVSFEKRLPFIDDLCRLLRKGKVETARTVLKDLDDRQEFWILDASLPRVPTQRRVLLALAR